MFIKVNNKLIINIKKMAVIICLQKPNNNIKIRFVKNTDAVLSI